MLWISEVNKWLGFIHTLKKAAKAPIYLAGGKIPSHLTFPDINESLDTKPPYV